MNSNPLREPAQSGSWKSQSSLNNTRPLLHPSDDYISLILRIWCRRGNESGIPEGSWHIEVEHIQSGGRWDFSTINELERFLNDFLKQLKEINQF